MDKETHKKNLCKEQEIQEDKDESLIVRWDIKLRIFSVNIGLEHLYGHQLAKASCIACSNWNTAAHHGPYIVPKENPTSTSQITFIIKLAHQS